MNLSFHTMITLAYTIPNVYVFFRIMQLFIGRAYRVRYAIIYFLIASIFPLSEVVNEESAHIAGRILITVSNYLLPFCLYLFLSVLLFDIFLLLNLVLKVLPSDTRKSAGFRKYALSAIIIVSALIVVGGVINFRTIRISEYKLEIPARSSEMHHLKIAFAADFHIDSDTDPGFMRRFCRRIEKISPDIMLFGGDIVEGHDGEKMEEQEQMLKQIDVRYGVYGVLGNHEYYRGQDRGSFFDKAGIKILRDSVVVIENAFNLAGRLDSHFSNRRSMNELLAAAVDSLPVILLDHRPTELPEVAKTRTDIQLSGHTHDGQMFPINLINRKVYLLSKGYKKIGNTNFFVTSGIRQWRFPVRTTGKSEIMVLDIDFIK
jgi:uncharacterized protein